MRRALVMLTLLLTACGGAKVAAGAYDTPPTYDTKPPHETTTTKPYETTTTYKQHETTTTYPHRETTTTYQQHETTTTKPPHETTTTYPQHETTTTVKSTTTTEKPHETTTTVKATTTTAAATTTTVRATTTTAAGTTTTTTGGGGTTTTLPTPGLFSVKAFAFCGSDFLPEISITFGNRPDLNGQTGVLSFSTGGSVFLVFQSNQTVTIPYPNTTQNVNLIYSLGPETATASVTYPGDCSTTTTGAPTSTTTTLPATTTTVRSTTTTVPVGTSTTTTAPVTTTTLPATTTTLPSTFTFGAAATVCIAEVPTITITFQNTFPQLAGRTGTLTMSDVNGNVVSVQPLVYQPGTTVHILYPGTKVNPDGSIADVPGWNLNADGFWVRDPTDAFLRDGIHLHYEVNPSADAFVTYPPESSTCANPSGPFPPGATPTTVHGATPTGTLPHTGASDTDMMMAIGFGALAVGSGLAVVTRRRRIGG